MCLTSPPCSVLLQRFSRRYPMMAGDTQTTVCSCCHCAGCPSRKRRSTSHPWAQRASKAPLEPQAAFHGVTGTKVLAFSGHWDYLDLGHCESGVWNTGRCCTCMALPTLYYSTDLSPPWIQAPLNLVARCAHRGFSWPLFFYRFTIFTTISLFGVPGCTQL